MISAITRTNAPHANSVRSITARSRREPTLARARADEPGSDRDEDADGERDPPGRRQRLRDDLPGVACGGPNGLAVDDIVDEVLPGRPADEDDEHADDGETDPERADLFSTAAASEPDRSDPRGNGQDPDEVRDLLEPVRDVLGGFEVVGLEDRDLRGILWDLVCEIADEVEVDRRAGGRAVGCRGRRRRSTWLRLSSHRGGPSRTASARPRSTRRRRSWTRGRVTFSGRPIESPREGRLSGRRAPGGWSGSLPSSSLETSIFANASTITAATCSWIAGLAISCCDVCLNWSGSSASRLT